MDYRISFTRLPKLKFYPFRLCLLIAMLLLLFRHSLHAQAEEKLIFQNPVLESGSAGNVGAVYRFSEVMDNIDALVEIAAMQNASLNKVDETSTGDQHAFQPVVRVQNQPKNGGLAYIDFNITFVESGSQNAVEVEEVTATAVDVDGDSYRLREGVCFSNISSYLLETPTNLTPIPVGTNSIQYEATTTLTLPGISPSGTEHMVTVNFENQTSFLYRALVVVDAASSPSSAKNRMFSLSFDPLLLSNYRNGQALPVTLVGFAGKVKAAQTVLSWATASETNNDFFEVQHAVDGLAFTSIGRVEGRGTASGSHAYEFIHTRPLKGSNYYRLKQVDVDGKFHYSPVIQVEVGELLAGFETYPNPVSEVLYVNFASPLDNYQVRLLSPSGGQLPVRFTEKADTHFALDTRSLPKGVYILQIEPPGLQQTWQHKVVVQ